MELMRGTTQNRVAARALRQARAEARMSQTDFAAAISERLGVERMRQATLSQYENATRSVPAAVLVAAVEIVDAMA